MTSLLLLALTLPLVLVGGILYLPFGLHRLWLTNTENDGVVPGQACRTLFPLYHHDTYIEAWAHREELWLAIARAIYAFLFFTVFFFLQLAWLPLGIPSALVALLILGCRGLRPDREHNPCIFIWVPSMVGFLIFTREDEG